jgi:cadmium resistance protein CadD (predicted permease)
VHSIGVVVIVASLAFIGTMCDNYFAFAAQLLVTDHSRYRRVSWAQAIGIIVLLFIAAGIGSLLAPVPTRWIGIFALAPWALAVQAWRTRDKPTHEQFRRGAITTFTLTLALGGDNLAVWIPLLRANGAVHAFVTLVVFALWEVLFIVSAQAIVRHPRVVTWGDQHAKSFVPWIYVVLGIVILAECGTFR